MLNASSLPTALLPASDALALAAITISPAQITVALVATRSATSCPLCGTLAQRIHSHYRRTLADLPWGQARVRLELTVRKFFCDTPSCLRRIFTERLPEVVAPYARRTIRLSEVLGLLAFALGGEAGGRLVARLRLVASSATLLRLIRRAPLPEHSTPRVLGVDDWAFRKGRTYGTILVDLERRRVVDLLPDRTAGTFAQWLRDHPGVAVVSRDRAYSYADGARQGAPTAVHIADRWHVLRNLAEALETFLLPKRAALRDAGVAPVTATNAVDVATPFGPGPRTPTRPRLGAQRLSEASQQRHERQVDRYERIQRLHAAGATVAQIGQQVGVSRVTVYRYRDLAEPPPVKRPHRAARRRVLTPFEPYLLERWREGCQTGRRLYREICARGYVNGPSNVMRFVAQLRRDEAAGTPAGTTARARGGPRPTARHVAMLFLRRPNDLDQEQQAYLARLRDGDPAVAAVYDLSQAFTRMTREQAGERLDAWLEQAAGSAPALARFARGLRTDYAAIRAGLTEVWSNGQTEGQVNKLKLLKRQMYGRAKFDLLRQRVLAAA